MINRTLMKQSTILYSLLILVLAASCKKQKMDVYTAGRYIQFTQPLTDTVNFSFLFYPGQPEIRVPMPLRLVGLMPEGNLSYQIKVDEKASTASTSHYSLPASFEFRKGLSIDSAYLTIRNAADLQQKTVLLVLEISTGNDVAAGQTTHIRKAFKINDMISRPGWWDARVETHSLGVYTDKKFRTFIQVTGVGDMTKYSPGVQRDYFLQFKRYLIQMKDNGTPVLENDGTDMLSTIRLIG